MYRAIAEKTKELKDGKTTKYLSDVMGMNNCHLTSVLNGKRRCSKLVAISLINIKTKIPLNGKKMEVELNKYFHKED